MFHISLKAEEVFNIGGWAVTNTLLLSILVVIALTVAAFFISRRLALVPGGAQNIIEVAIEGILGMMDSVLVDRKKSERYLPIVATIFFFILFANWSGILPGLGAVGIKHDSEFTPLFRPPASDLNFTLALALIAVLFINITATMTLGPKIHLSKFINFKNPVSFFIGILELVSEFAKIISFSFRLFGNIFAGKVLLLIMAALIPYLIPLPFLFLEIFIGFIQAFIFAMLTLVFIAISTAPETAH